MYDRSNEPEDDQERAEQSLYVLSPAMVDALNELIERENTRIRQEYGTRSDRDLQRAELSLASPIHADTVYRMIFAPPHYGKAAEQFDVDTIEEAAAAARAAGIYMDTRPIIRKVYRAEWQSLEGIEVPE